MNDAVARIKSLLPEHPPVADIAPLAGDYTGLRILAVHAHPDDESSKGAASAAAYTARGARYMVATMTGGERGDILNETIKHSPRAHRDLPGVRRAEMAAAAEVMKIEHRWMGFVDSGLPEGDPLPPLPFGSFATMPLERAAAPLVRLVRQFRPHVMISYDENGGYPHPDHIMTHKVAVEAFEKSGDPEAYVGEGEPWSPLKLYYDRMFNAERIVAMYEFLLSRGTGGEFAQWLEATANRIACEGQPHESTTRILSADYFDKREEAMRAHASQIDPNGVFFVVSTEDMKRIWPWEDYTLISSKVPVDLPESSFATGIDYRGV